MENKSIAIIGANVPAALRTLVISMKDDIILVDPAQGVGKILT